QRRNFLLALGAGGAGAAIVAARALSTGPAAPAAADEPSSQGKGYALTDHVRRYYRTAKI
ncbi:MAG TPA: formate dehydrogenase, partial [Casimicrobiaceae bacterium]|nr:formate dehydrogenase [Casimicrobiaceae bacterium]